MPSERSGTLPTAVAPFLEDLLDVERHQVERRSRRRLAESVADLGIQRLDDLADGRLARQAGDPGADLLDLLAQCERRWEVGQLLALQELLDPPEIIAGLVQV